jgi:hypothetical protein
MATMSASSGEAFVESSRMRAPSGYSHISTTMRRRNVADGSLSLSTKMGPRTDRSSMVSPSGAWVRKNARWSDENSLLSRFSPETLFSTAAGRTVPFRDAEHT